MVEISIIVPVYNVEKYIGRCIDSVLRQSFSDWELILVDDGSTDASGKLCRNYAAGDARIKVIHQQNSGQGIARNTGYEMASGRYIFFLDPDDWIRSDALEQLWKKANAEQADIVFFDHMIVAETEKNVITEKVDRLPISLQYTTNCLQTPEILYSVQGSVCDKLFFKDVLHGIRQVGHPYEDSAVLPLILLNATRITQLQEPLYYYWTSRADSTVNKTDTVFYMRESMAEVHENIQRDKYPLEVQEAVRKYIEWMYLVAKNHVQRVGKEGEDTYQRFLEDCWDQICEWFPTTSKVMDAQVAVLGSYNLRCIVNRARRNLRLPLYWQKNILQIEQDQIDWNQIRSADYVCVDLLGEGWTYQEEQLDALIETLKVNIPVERIILVESYLCESHGVYGGMKPFDEIKQIRHVNQWLDSAYKKIKERLSGMHLIAFENSSLNYTDEYYPHGCKPWHMNEYAYAVLEEKMEKILIG